VEITSTNQKNKGASSDNQVKATIDKEADRIYFKQTSEKKKINLIKELLLREKYILLTMKYILVFFQNKIGRK